jgi:hypothetical protein
MYSGHRVYIVTSIFLDEHVVHGLQQGPSHRNNMSVSRDFRCESWPIDGLSHGHGWLMMVNDG